jgi:curved DNA-binding protein CbpA
MKIKQCYQRLELPYEATAIEIRQAYKRLVKKWHPDKFDANSPMKAYAEERLKIINAAYDFLCKHRPSIKTHPISKNENSPIRSLKKSNSLNKFLQNTAFVRSHVFSGLSSTLILLKNLFYSTGSKHVHTCQTEEAANQKSQKNFKQDLRILKESCLKTCNNDKRKQNGYKTIYDLRKHYGPRQKKGTGSISAVAALDKTQTLRPVHRVAPIRSIK